jgi:hypothetical protein
MKKLEDLLSNEAAMHAPLHEIERMLETHGREMLRAMMQSHFICARHKSGALT